MAKTRLSLDVDGTEVSVSSPEKVYFPEAGLTKLDVVEYYRAVAEAALRAAGDRPLVLKRYVNGIAAEAFYQKRAPPSRPDWIDTVTLRFPSGRKADEIVLHHAAQLVWVVNLGCLELHVHPVRSGDLDHPDELRIDLDPVPGVEWPQIREVGFSTREVLEELGLVGWPKTSGSRGLHVYVRIRPRWTFTEVRRAALAIAREVERRAPPGVASSRWWKEERQGVFLDYNQNAKDRTMAAAWSVRPTPDARVSMPLTWSELADANPADFTLRTAPARLRAVGDPHREMDAHAGDLGPALELVARHEAEGLGDAAWPPHYVKQADEPARVQPSRRRPTRPLVEIGRAKRRDEALAGLERWKARHPEVVPYLEASDVLVDRMRGRHSEWTRIRVNLEHVPEDLRPPQEALDPDYDVASEWGGGAAETDAASELPRVPGLGEAKARALHEALGVTSVEELEEAARAGRVRSVRGFGPKTEARILEAIALQRERSGWWLSSEALEAANAIRERLRPVAERVEIAGDLRRGVELVREVELVASALHPEPVLDRLAGELARVHLRELVASRAERFGEPRAESGRLVGDRNDGLPVSLRVVPTEGFGAAWQHASAGDGHRAALADRARDRGLVFDADGLHRDRARVATPDEADLARRLEVAWVPPELRDEAASLDVDPRSFEDLVTVDDLTGMIHCHTTWSDGQNTIEEMARAAESRGFRYLTITDHSASAFYANGLTVEELRRQWDEIDRVQERVGIRILKGTEADILVDGALDFPAVVLERLDVVVASVHSRFQLSEEEMTARLVRAMRAPVFKIWGHPLGRRLLRREPVSIRLDEILDAAADSRAAIEINADPHRLDLPPAQIREARARGIPFVVAADAHSVAGMGVLPFGIAIARRGGVTRAEVLNVGPTEAFVDAVRPI